MQHDQVFVFDLDGVITRPSDSSVDARAVEHIHELLRKGIYVAVNTGRSFAWVESNFLSPLKILGGSDAFDHLFIACEKGGESVTWHEGTFQFQPSRFALSPQNCEITHQVYEANADSLSTMFWDATKTTMATIEKRPESDLEKFRAEQQFLVAKLEHALAGQAMQIDPTTIATDVESPRAGKHAGAELIYEWMVSHIGTTPRAFVSFGDSRGDYEMARYFAGQSADSTFVFVGAKAVAFTEDPQVKLVRTQAEYAAGTLEYFDQHDL
jgi:hydroxymethylpyrimidine pyrophosphatase-like HAD family hydrolase